MNKPDHTEYACADRCEQEWVWRHARHLVPAVPDAAAHFGQRLHAAVAALYAGTDVSAALGTWEPVDPKKPHLTVSRAHTLVKLYAAQWLEQQAMFDVVWNEGYTESDQECAIPDRCVRSKVDGLLYAMDLKTTGLYITAEWQQHFEHNQQVAIQLDVLEYMLKEPIAGFWLDCIHVSRSTPTARDFSRYGPLPYSAELRAELRAQRARKRETLRTLERHSELAEKRTEACVRFGGRLCPYFALCRADPADREALVQIQLARGQLVMQVWNPSQRDVSLDLTNVRGPRVY